MNEFKTVVEQFRDDQKKFLEVMNHKFDQQEVRMTRQEKKSDSMMEQIALLHEGQTAMKAELNTAKDERNGMRDQISLLHEGQTEIKAELKTELKSRVTYADFEQLEKRVMRLENKVA